MIRWIVAALTVVVFGTAVPARASAYVVISGAGSTWSQNALDQWRRNVVQYGMTVNYAGTGSSDGRSQFRNGTVDFAVSEIPYGLTDAGVIDPPPGRRYAYMPIVAGGTAFMYNLRIGAQRVTNLRLSGEVVAKIFTGQITTWNDPAIAADNPSLRLPARRIVPVVRSDGSGTTAQFSTWLAAKHPAIWNAYCARAGRPGPCGITSYFPVVAGSPFVAQAGSLGVAGYVRQAQSEGAITYVEYSYALNTNFPVAKLLNRRDYYVEPTAENVAVGLLGARINNVPSSPGYLTQDLRGVYDNNDPRAYPLSSYSYMIVPTAAEGAFNASKGETLGAFAYYFLCEGQRQAKTLGYSPLPINLVQAGLDQVRRIPGVNVQNVNIRQCNNPTFSTDGTNTLARTAPQPSACDRRGATAQCSAGTGGASNQPTNTGGGGTGTGGPGQPGAGQSAAGQPGAGQPTAGQSAAGQPAGGQIDPDTGLPVAGTSAGGGSGDVVGEAVTLASRPAWDQQRTLMSVAGGLLLILILGPPLLARRIRRPGGRP